MSAYQLPLWVWPTAMMGVGVISVRRGADEDRLALGGLLAAWALSMVVFRDRSQNVQLPVLFIDLALFLLYVWIALRSRRYWPLFAAGFQLLAFLTHIPQALGAGVTGWAYMTAERLWSYLVLITIGYGAWSGPKARRAEAERAADPGAG